MNINNNKGKTKELPQGSLRVSSLKLLSFPLLFYIKIKQKMAAPTSF